MTVPSEASTVAADELSLAWRAAVEEILGPEGKRLHVVGRDAALPWQRLLPSLCAAYGEVAGLGLGVRIGRAFARETIPLLAGEAGFQVAEFRFLPWSRKMPVGMQRLGEMAGRWFATPIEVTVEPRGVLWQSRQCPFAPPEAERRYRQRCTPWVGFLQETLYWMSGGRWFVVQYEETTACAFRIAREPLH